jgi:hypothetical protein
MSATYGWRPERPPEPDPIPLRLAAALANKLGVPVIGLDGRQLTRNGSHQWLLGYAAAATDVELRGAAQALADGIDEHGVIVLTSDE